MSYGVLKTVPAGPIKPEREAELLKAGDLDTLVLESMYEAFLYATECSKGREGESEVFSACYAALKKAAGRFDPKFDVRFFPFAKAFVRGELKLERRRLRVVRPANKNQRYDFLPVEKLPTESQGASDNFLDANRLHESKTFRSDFQPKVGFEQSEEADIDRSDRSQMWKEFSDEAERLLTPRAYKVVKLHIIDGLGWQEIADQLGFTREAHRAMFEKAMRKLRCSPKVVRTLLKYEHLGA